MTNKDYKRLTVYNEEMQRPCMTADFNEETFDIVARHVDRLYELEIAIENGTLVFLPCKVGDTIYEVFKNHRPPFIQQTTIEKIIITRKGLRLKLERNSTYETSITAWEKTLFPTEEAAEKALEELGVRHNNND